MRRSVRVRVARNRAGEARRDPDRGEETRAEPGSGREDLGATEFDPAGFDPFGNDSSDIPDPNLTAVERAAAEEEARHGIPTSAAVTASPGERRVEGRFREALAKIRGLGDGALARLRAAQHDARARAPRIEAAAARERDHGLTLPEVAVACQRLDARHHRAQAAARELAGFRRARGLPDYASPRPPSRGWIWLLLAVALAETTANGLLLHAASTEGVVSNWLFAALITGMNVGLLGWLIGDLIFRRMLRAGAARRAVLAAALIPCLLLAGLLHFGFAHYRDAVQALDAARVAGALNLDDIDAGAESASGATDPHPPPPVSVEEAVIGELRAQFLWWTPGASFVDHPAEVPPDDHSLDTVRQLPAGEVGYRAEDGSLVLAEDPLAGRFEGWRSLLLLGIGFTALLLAAWKWFGGREPIPHFARLHAARESAARALESEYADASRRLDGEEQTHRGSSRRRRSRAAGARGAADRARRGAAAVARARGRTRAVDGGGGRERRRGLSGGESDAAPLQ